MACVVQRLRKSSTDMSRIQFISQAANTMLAQAKQSRQSVLALPK